ncbi:DEAD2 [Arabidopsis thaliana x Arabidopsis arenosa]|uniref:DNA 5'-3' helicase FANCJ n=1 Tax=Arabidopsis thaliana x Arabidopsis arenosa TaxID=1240361 RepID=A0A8T2GGQ4_9BRAS|nr:DEAD2 [Arabidopsis thaliana x Arabidopsis arenosa]
MASTRSKSDSKEEVKQTLNSKNPKNVYQIGGLQVEFPYQPYGTQLAFMSRVISTLDRAQRDGHSHALLESPTDIAGSSNVEPHEPQIPTIYYASRTHAQITQVIREYRKTGYRVPMTVLGSRKRYCTNSHVQGKENVDEKCRLLLKDKKNIKCAEFNGVGRIVAYPSLQQTGHNGVHDIEDLVKIGKTVTGRLLKSFTVHSNMEDIAREAGSINLEEDIIFKLKNELEQMSEVEPEIYDSLYEVVEGLISWIGRKKDSLAKRDVNHYFSNWTGDRALKELKEFNITRENFPNLKACFNQAITKSEAAEIDPDKPYLSGISVSTLEELFATLTYFFSRNGSHVLDYEMGLQRSAKRDNGWTNTFSLWCMNPSVVFKDLADLSLSIILTSGTLSPMNSFSSELGMQFGTCLEAPHVIDPNMQVWAGAISTVPGNYPLNASYRTAEAYAFQDALGKSLEEICTIVPGGSLVFFPSYKLMEKLCTRWHETGQWSRLCLKTDLFIEPRGGSKDDFETVLKEYYDSISGKNRLIGRNSSVKKAGSVITEAQDDSKRGSAFLAVCRGKVSEGMDFSDDNARAVIIVGIPLPNLGDILVELKRKYNDTNKSSKNLLGGSEWYCQQAYRALNQAAGRCIRHRFDYGAIIFLVIVALRLPTTKEQSVYFKVAKASIKVYDNFEASMEGLRYFFSSVKERVDSKMLESHEQNLSSENQRNEFVRKENQTQNKSSHVEPKQTIPAHTFIQVKREAECCKGVIDLDCEVQPEPGYCEESSVTNCDEDPETSFVSGMINGIATARPCSSSKYESSSLETGLRSLKSPDQFLKRHVSNANFRRSPLGAESSVTPERYSIGDMRNMTLEAESPLNMSVNSHVLKRRKFTTSPIIIDLEEENSNAPDNRPEDHTSFTRRIEFGFPEVDQRVMRISCSLCRSTLSHPENNSYPICMLTSSSKTYLLSLLKETSGTGSAEMPTSVSVIMTDCSLVNQRLCTNSESSNGQGIWCQQDGCVFKTIFCPFCSVPNTCLGMQVMATDSSNVQFMSKILFFADHLEVTNDAASKETRLTHKVSTLA